VRFDLNDYSIPHTKVQRLLTVLADPNEVRIVDGAQVLACRRRSYDKGAQIEDAAHIQALVAHCSMARPTGASSRSNTLSISSAMSAIVSFVLITYGTRTEAGLPFSTILTVSNFIGD